MTWLAAVWGRWVAVVVEYLRRDSEAVPPDPAQTFSEAPSLHEVLASNNDAFDIPIVSLGAPTDPTDAATKNYVDLGGPFVVSATDPGIVLGEPAPVGAGRIWVDTSSDPTTWQRRNASDDGWDAPFLQMGDDGTLEVVGNDTEPVTVRNGDANIVMTPDTVTIQNATGGELVVAEFTVTLNSTVIDGDGNVTFGGGGAVLPTSDPGVAGKVYTDGAIAPGVPQALMVSGGPP